MHGRAENSIKPTRRGCVAEKVTLSVYFNVEFNRYTVVVSLLSREMMRGGEKSEKNKIKYQPRNTRPISLIESATGT